jgi:hypothetical protein
MSVLFFLDAPFSILWGVMLTPASLVTCGIIGSRALLALTAEKQWLPQLSTYFMEQLRLRNVSVD